MRKIAFFFVFLFAGINTAFAQRIPLEVSFGVGGYFPEDGRYSHFFEHNPANFSGQVTYKWSVLDFKAGFESMRKRTDKQEKFFDFDIIPDFGTLDTIRIIHTATDVKSYVRASGFRLGVAFHPFREAAFSPFVGFGGSFGSSKGHGDSLAVVIDTILDYTQRDTITGEPDTTVRDISPPPSQVAEFSKNFSGFYLEAGAQARLPYNFFFVFEAIRDFRSNNKAGVIGPVKGGGTLIGMRLGYRF
ncbi:MAG: hypothetical protein L0196_01985 [candidate division Zixibacteria bacterium]|nr:hypothetical protein [candidate division Zixibacteria bacterium]